MNRVSAPSYDLFKTIVAVVLAVILLLMLLRGCAVNPSPSTPTEIVPAQEATETLASAPISMETAALAEATRTITPTPLPTEVEPTPTTVAPTPTATAPTNTAAAEATEPPIAAPEQTTSTPQAEEVSCNTRVPSRLSVGQTARVIQRLNMRSDPSITAPVLQTNPLNTQVEIIGGPVCTPVGNQAYLWWQIRLANGAEGWSAETPLNEPTYFLEPVP